MPINIVPYWVREILSTLCYFNHFDKLNANMLIFGSSNLFICNPRFWDRSDVGKVSPSYLQ